MKGKFITVEGSDGSGKTSFINFATEYLKEKGYKKRKMNYTRFIASLSQYLEKISHHKRGKVYRR